MNILHVFEGHLFNADLRELLAIDFYGIHYYITSYQHHRVFLLSWLDLIALSKNTNNNNKKEKTTNINS